MNRNRPRSNCTALPVVLPTAARDSLTHHRETYLTWWWIVGLWYLLTGGRHA